MLSSPSQPLCVDSLVMIQCNITLDIVSMSTDLNYYWYHNDNLIEGNNITITDNETVFTTQISISLPGTYTCKANITSSDQTKLDSLEVKGTK